MKRQVSLMTNIDKKVPTMMVPNAAKKLLNIRPRLTEPILISR